MNSSGGLPVSLRCYRHFSPPAAIGFDLDDTLYNNAPVLLRAEQELEQFLHRQFSATRHWSARHWSKRRLQHVSQDPGLAQDISFARLYTLERGLLAVGYPAEQASRGARQAMEVFLHWRSQVTISPDTHQLLARLSARWPLFVISNGNADVESLGLSSYFQFALHAGNGRMMKPAPDLFTLAKQRLKLPDHQVFYVGDHPVADIVGANRAGWHSVWLNPQQRPLQHRNKPLQLPTLEISHLEVLAQLL